MATTSAAVTSSDLTFNDKVGPAYTLATMLKGDNLPVEAWAELPDEFYVSALSRSEWLGSRGLTIPDNASDSDIVVAIRASRAFNSLDPWMRGDIMAHVHKARYNGGEIPIGDMKKWSDSFGCHYSRLYSNMLTAESWSMDDRYPASTLTYSHHEVLVAIPADQRKGWADRAIADHMNKAQLQEAITNDAISISEVVDPNSLQVVERKIEFTSDNFDRDKAIRIIADAITHEYADVGNVRTAAQNVLTEYADAILITFKSKNWITSIVAAQAAAKAEATAVKAV